VRFASAVALAVLIAVSYAMYRVGGGVAVGLLLGFTIAMMVISLLDERGDDELS
jgi:NhaP-type Na+/H+ or K+/H+ antiporter